VQNERILAYHYGMAGVVAALVPYDNIGVLGIDIYDLALALIAPLRAYDRYIF
jgi:hypothetical protein